MAGTSAAQISIVVLYDCYTDTPLVTLEDYRFCQTRDTSGPWGHDTACRRRLSRSAGTAVTVGLTETSSFW
ncbi:hypothetical protein [Mycolicibacter sinensis]